jgi:hypothetical protein
MARNGLSTAITTGHLSNAGGHRKRKADGDIDFRMRDGDVWLIVSVKDSAWKKERHSLGVFDFEFTKCVYNPAAK